MGIVKHLTPPVHQREKWLGGPNPQGAATLDKETRDKLAKINNLESVIRKSKGVDEYPWYGGPIWRIEVQVIEYV